MPQGQIQSFQQCRTNAKTERCQSRRTVYDSIRNFDQTSLDLFFDNLAIDQIGVCFLDRISWSPSLPCFWEDLDRVVVLNQGLKLATKPVTKETRYSENDSGRDGDESECCFQRSRSDYGGQQKTSLWSIADPNPLTAILGFLGAFRLAVRLLAPLSFDKAPHFV